MAIATYQDFLLEPVCKQYEHNKDFQKIFQFLNQGKMINKMIEASEEQLPALQACSKLLEDFCKKYASSEFKFDDQTKQSLGKMVKVILKPFGYLPDEEMPIPKELNLQFKNAMRYALTGEATVKLLISIEEI